MAKLWVFGDSFCAHNENWVKTLGDKSNSEVIIKARPASSIFFTYKSIVESQHLFSKEDSIIVGITNYSRHLFNGKHFIIQEYIKSDSLSFELTDKDNEREVVEAYGLFLKYLYSHEEERIRALSMVESILNLMSKRLNVKTFIPFFTLNGDKDFEQFNYLDFNFKKYPSFWDFFANFIDDKLGVSKKNIQEIVKITDTPNHWIDHPEWEQHFWNTYAELFKPLIDG